MAPPACRLGAFSPPNVQSPAGTGLGEPLDVARPSGWRPPAPPVPGDGAGPRDLASGVAELHLRTPLRLTADGPPSSPDALGFDFRKLAFRTIRRALEIAHFHVPEATLDWHFKPMLRAASQTVRLTAVDLRWHDWERWSNRQRRPMRLGGHVGRLRLQGELGPFVQLLATAELLHVGKGATFGLGRVEVRNPGTGDAG